MITTPAIIRAKSGQTSPVTATLLEVAAHLDADEPETKSFRVLLDLDDDRVFTTYERFASLEARDRHNNSSMMIGFFNVADQIIEHPMILHSCEDISERASA